MEQGELHLDCYIVINNYDPERSLSLSHMRGYQSTKHRIPNAHPLSSIKVLIYAHPPSASVNMRLGALVLATLAGYALAGPVGNTTEPRRFAEDFLFGVATAAYQVEGAWDEDGKGESIWDHMTHETPNTVDNEDNGDVACDSYHKYKEDVQLIKAMNMDFYRFSISWPRILPNGDLSVISQKGIDYYNNLIDELIAQDIEPKVTMYHWDLPFELQKLGGWTNGITAQYFADYAKLLYTNFGDRVKTWITFNEPQVFCSGYGGSVQTHAPAIDLPGIGPYRCGHTLLLAHSKAYHEYELNFKPTQKGKVGITLPSAWYFPKTESEADKSAAERGMQFGLGWFAHPIFSEDGDYPEVMRERIQELSTNEGRRLSRLPQFTQEEVQLLKGSADFFGLNHYSSNLVKDGLHTGSDEGIIKSYDPSWPDSGAAGFKVVPEGFRELLKWVKNTYNNPPIIVTENGFSDTKGILNDVDRVEFYRSYLTAMHEAITEDGVNVFGYTAWSLMDNFEWLRGYTVRFGLHLVDFEDEKRTRTAKDSAKFMGQIAQTHEIPVKETDPDTDHDSEGHLQFDDDFRFGVATASYQIEGAWNEDGKGENIWDHMLHEHPEYTADRQNGDVACDSYHKYKEDVQMIKEMNMDFYRFSISWPRILPNGDLSVINKKGIDYYNNLINELLENNIDPMVTMYHWDLPYELQKLGGWANPQIALYFKDYAELLFKTYGDRVKSWITFNEPQVFCRGYAGGYGLAPEVDKAGIAEYKCGRTLLLAHAYTYHLYVRKYFMEQQGEVGITLNSYWSVPKTDSSADIAATKRELQFWLGWFAHPIFSPDGDYPEVMRQRVAANSANEGRRRSRLPEFTAEEKQLIQGSSDFFGLNHYTTNYVENGEEGGDPSHARDGGYVTSQDPSWPTSGSKWLKVVPDGFRSLLTWIKYEYDGPKIIVTENGVSDRGNNLDDQDRIEFFRLYLTALHEAKYVDSVNIIGYTAWSLMDNFEWPAGYTEKFGLYEVDFESSDRTRTPKASVKYLGDIASTHIIPSKEDSKDNGAPAIRSKLAVAILICLSFFIARA